MQHFLAGIKTLRKEILHTFCKVRNMNRSFKRIKSKKIREHIDIANLHRMIPFVLLIILSQIINLMVIIFSNAHRGYILYCLGTTLFLLFFSVLYLFYIASCLKEAKKHNHKKAVLGIYWFIYVSSSLVFSIIDIAEYSTIYNYIILWAILAIISLFNIRQQMIFLFYCTAVQSAAIFLLKAPIILFYRSLTISIGAVFLSQVLLFSFISYVMAKIRLEDTNRRLKHLSCTDPLTNLLNRRGCEKYVENIWSVCVAKKALVILAIVDIDYFKSLNDKYGHIRGDESLTKVANCIYETCHEKVDIITRFGGEEFLIFVTKLSERQMIQLMQQVKDRIENLKIKPGRTDVSDYLTVSIGISTLISNEGGSFDRLLNIADQELYKAKKNGRNCIVCDNVLYGRNDRKVITGNLEIEQTKNEHIAEAG